MGKNALLSFLLPKENKFFPLFKAAGLSCVEASNYLVQFVNETDFEKQKELYKKIKECEVAGDATTNTIFKELNETFITPFDREDIHDLCEALDDVIDYITSSAKRVILFRPKHIPELTKKMAVNIAEGCQAINVAMGELKTIAKHPNCALSQCSKIHDLEHAADDIYEQFVTELFENEKDSIELIKNKEIMQELEHTTDRSRIVGKILKTIIVKYA